MIFHLEFKKYYSKRYSTWDILYDIPREQLKKSLFNLNLHKKI